MTTKEIKKTIIEDRTRYSNIVGKANKTANPLESLADKENYLISKYNDLLKKADTRTGKQHCKNYIKYINNYFGEAKDFFRSNNS